MGKTFLTIIITALVVGGGVYIWQNTTPTEEPDVGKDICQNVISYNCEQSGGKFINGKCDCSTTGDEFVEYEDSTGYCITAIGSPGGDILETTKKLLELQMLKNQLNE